MHRKQSIFLFTLSVCACTSLQAQERIDTTRTYRIHEVIIRENRKVKELRSTTPLQILDAGKLRNSGAMQLSDAAKMFSGAVVKDYGGFGGMKTISIRSLGANHTAVAYDGITLTDTQTGQIDLGKISLSNVDIISLNSGQNDNIFQPARLFASAAVLNILSASPVFEGKNTNLQTSVKAGSFGLANPALQISRKWNRIFSSSVSAEYMYAGGAYPYTLYNSAAPEKRHRKNADIETWKAEAGLHAAITERQQAALKIYYYQSERGLPSNILYNTYAGERLWDKNVFAQGHYENRFDRHWALNIRAKFNWSYNYYQNKAMEELDGIPENHYYQNEYYLSAVLQYRLNGSLSFSLANDGSINHLHTDLADFPCPTRYTLLNVLAAKYVNERFTAIAHLLSTLTKETVQRGKAAGNKQKLSPSVSFSYRPFAKEDLRIRLLYKNIFRLPTFNDLYYGTVGRRTLKPEIVNEWNTGLSWMKEINRIIPAVSVNADVFYNRIKDKIIVTPQNPFISSMMNVGRVDIKGMEVNAEMQFVLFPHTNFTINGSYTYQRALDKTDKYEQPGKYTYNHQIPYTPKHSGSVRIGLETPWINLSYSAMVSGNRYRNQYNAPEYRMEGFKEHSISVWRAFKMKTCSFVLQAEVLNLTNEQYDIVYNYPMPGRQFRASVTFKY